MKINLSPSRTDQQLTASVGGDVVTLNGQALDFGPIEEGEIWMSDVFDCIWFIYATRVDGQIEVTILLPYGPGAPYETRFPSPIYVTEDGPLDLPPYTNEMLL